LIPLLFLRKAPQGRIRRRRKDKPGGGALRAGEFLYGFEPLSAVKAHTAADEYLRLSKVGGVNLAVNIYVREVPYALPQEAKLL